MALGAANADARLTGGYRFAAHVALYPTCGTESIVRGGSGAPVLVLIGTLDELTGVSSCERLMAYARAAGRDATLIVYKGAYHGWDGDFSGVWFHRAIKRSYAMYPDQSTTEKSRTDVLVFLKKALRLSP
jgi:dienelactone hydrolase